MRVALVGSLSLLASVALAPTLEAQTPEFMIDFRNPAHRAQTLENGLEFIATYPAGSNPRWALYRVTSATPRIEFPGAVVPVDTNDYGHLIRICTSGGYFADDYDDLLAAAPPCVPGGISGTCTTHVGTVGIQLGGNKTPVGETEPVDSIFGTYHTSAGPWGSCRYDGDRGGGLSTMEPVDGLYLQVVPTGDTTEVPLGAVIPLRMVAMGNGLNTANHERPPELCCENELDCTVGPYCGDGIKAPWEICDDGNNVNGDGCDADCEGTGEPPDPTDPPDGGGPGEPPDPSGQPDGGPGEPPDPSNPPGGGEPPGLSEPPGNGNGVPQCQVSFGEPLSGSPFATLIALAGVAALRRRAARA